MSEKVNYWVCRCGKTHLQSTRKCDECGRRRSIGKATWGLFGLVGLIVAGTLLPPASEDPAAPKLTLPAPETAFLATIGHAAEEVVRQPNSVAKKELLLQRDRSVVIASGDGHVEDWIGEVEAVSSMSEGAGLAIVIGEAGSTLVAGVYLGLGLDTLIRPGDPIYQKILTLKKGDKVVFSGELQMIQGAAVDLSYTTGSPRYLFRFTSIHVFSE